VLLSVFTLWLILMWAFVVALGGVSVYRSVKRSRSIVQDKKNE
jgi:hypothetical protein